MPTLNRQAVGRIVRWTARLWTVPLIATTYLLAAQAFISPRFRAPDRVVGLFATPFAMAFAVAFVIAWRWERIGGWLGLISEAAFHIWVAIRWRSPGIGLVDLLFLPPALLFLLAAALDGKTQEPGGRRFFAVPRTDLGWVSILAATGFFVFLRLFWMQAFSPGRNRSTFFSDPINAACLIGAFGTPIVGMILALVAIIWKHERSWMLSPVILLGVFGLLWALAAAFGNP